MAQSLKKVLIVDDEETLTWSMSKSLSRDRDKYTILIANTGREALEILEKNEVGLVITDIRLPDINGLDLLTTIKNDYPDTKVIIMTAYGSSDIQKEANKRGSLYYIEKPFEIVDIRKLILDILWKKRGFEGNVFDLQLTDIIQLNCLCRITAALKVKRGEQEGVIYFSDGEIVHAECDGQIGKEALHRILKWREGKFDHERAITPPQQTIFQSWEHLLVEGMRNRDEQSSSASPAPEMEPGLDSPPEGDQRALHAEAEDHESDEKPMEEAVRSIIRVAGCEGTLIVSEDGMVLAQRDIKNAAKEGVMVAFLGVLSNRMSRVLGTGELQSILVGRKKKKAILKNTPYYFEVQLKEGVGFDDVGPSLWKTVRDFKESYGRSV
ncbi:MAG: response regulator [Deltaproteobacteria bacterium]|nr:response regulator [Deltaproteobacteria bacterium]MBW2123315.1 response regulator [Deltaproteobacteria bacterium]